MSSLSNKSSNKSNKERSDDAGELNCQNENLSEEALLLGYHHKPLEDKLAKAHPDLLEESTVFRDDEFSYDEYGFINFPEMSSMAMTASATQPSQPSLPSQPSQLS
jgi:hypothetical protein